MRRSSAPASTIFLVTAFAGTLALSACSSSNASVEDATDRDDTGEVVEGGDLGVFRLQLGDCVVLPGGTDPDDGQDEVESLTGVPCSEEHTGEVILVDGDHFADLTEFPGQTEAFDASLEPCVGALDSYTATVYEDSTFDVYSLVPTAQSWDALDDRELVCIGYTLNDELTEILSTTGSIRAD